MSDTVLVSRADGIATVTLNRPRSLNALTRAMWGELRDAFRATSKERRYLAAFRQQHFELLKRYADLKAKLAKMRSA